MTRIPGERNWYFTSRPYRGVISGKTSVEQRRYHGWVDSNDLRVEESGGAWWKEIGSAGASTRLPRSDQVTQLKPGYTTQTVALKGATDLDFAPRLEH